MGSIPFPMKHHPPRPGQPHPCLCLGSNSALRRGCQAPVPLPAPAQGHLPRAPLQPLSASEAPAEALPPPAPLQSPTVSWDVLRVQPWPQPRGPHRPARGAGGHQCQLLLCPCHRGSRCHASQE